MAAPPLDRVCGGCGLRTARWTPARCPACGGSDFEEADAPWLPSTARTVRRGSRRRPFRTLARIGLLMWVVLLALGILASIPLWRGP